jgi:hypothetical protein
LLGQANIHNPAIDDPFDGLRSLDDVSGECTPGAGHLGYRDTSSSDVERAIKLAEKFEEERYQQLKRVTCRSDIYRIQSDLTAFISRTSMAGMPGLEMIQTFCLS